MKTLQTFYLNLEEINKLNNQEKTNLSFKIEDLIKELRNKGYSVLKSYVKVETIPMGLIIFRKKTSQAPKDFSGVVEKLARWFKLGRCSLEKY